MKKRKTYWQVKKAINETYGSQGRGSIALQIPETRLSKIVQGHVTPSAKELEALARGLGKRAVSELRSAILAEDQLLRK